jgi:TRAP-type C4-dicarboxylate transport system substrate-binding protein
MWNRKNMVLSVAASVLLVGQVTASADTFNLRVGSGFPSAPTVYVNVLENYFVPELIKRVKDRTGHTINVTQAHGGSVAKPNETVAAIESGLLDMGIWCVCFEASKFPLNNFPYWVPFGHPSSVAVIRATRKVYDQYPQLTESMEKRYGQKMIAIAGFDNYHLGSSFKWDKLSDLKGKKVGAAGPNLPWLQGSGAIGVSTTLPEIYNALKSGIFDGVIMFPSSYNGFKFYEPAPNLKLVSLGAVSVMLVSINVKTLNRLPKEVQAILFEVARDYEARVGVALDESNANGLARLKDAGAVITEMSVDARKSWAEGLSSWPNKMAKDMDKTGMPGSAILKSYMQYLKAEGWKPVVEYPVQ